ncbi:MAG: creatininase family protein [Isosphaeraceae bacterium]
MRLQELSWPAIAAVSKNVPVVVPIAAVEQHGRHLPIFTDSMLLEEVVRTVAQRLGDRIVWAPLLWPVRSGSSRCIAIFKMTAIG